MSDQAMMGTESWPSGLNVMVVEGNALYLFLMEQLLHQCNYNVTTFQDVSEAISYVMKDQRKLDLVISDVFLPNEEGLLILKTISFQLDIPVVMMSWHGETSLVMKCIENGACDFLIKPVRIKELKNIWQHVFRRRIGNHTKEGMRFYLNINNNNNYRKRIDDGQHSDSTKYESDRIVADVRDLKKSRLHWTRQLHHQFVTAVNILGVDKAVPRKILKIMKVRRLTREHIASHLQKYRLHLKRQSSSPSGNDVAPSTQQEGLPLGLDYEIAPPTFISLQEHQVLDEGTCNIYPGETSRGSNFKGEESDNFFSELVDEFSGELLGEVSFTDE